MPRQGPAEHLDDAQKLRADAFIDLFEIELADTSTLYLKANNTVTWQGNSYEGYGIKVDNVARDSGDSNARPKLYLANPEGLFSSLVRTGKLDNALVTRIRVLKTHIDTNQNICRRESWKIRRVTSMTRETIQVELRDQLDGQFFLVPFRQYMPPDFPTVNLG